MRKLYRRLRRSFGLFVFSLSKERKLASKKLSQIKNQYSGKRLFIVCNGPSLKAEDLDKIYENGDYSFASNKIDKIFTQTKWRPTFYSIVDESYQYSLFYTMNAVPALYKFFRRESYPVTRKVSGNCIWFRADGDRKLLDNPKFSEDCAKVIYSIGTVTYAMIEIAVYMGFRELYIIGCDNFYGIERQKDGAFVNNGIASYFFFDGGGEKGNYQGVGATWEMNIAYDCARKYADEHNIKIFNATRGGRLEAFERVDFDSLF